MPSPPSRRDVLSLCGLAVGLGAAGCLGGRPSDLFPPDPTPTPDATGTPAATPTLPRSAVSDREARERAIAAEEEYLAERLGSADCLRDWGTHATTADERASVETRTAEAVVVDARHPYWYTTGTAEGDDVSRARYHVTREEERRVDGDAVSPC